MLHLKSNIKYLAVTYLGVILRFMVDKLGGNCTMPCLLSHNNVVSYLIYCLILVAGVQAWSKEGHIMTCRIAQVNY